MHTNYMAMSPYDFDQSPQGWQSLDAQGKYLEAAQLIEEYLSKNEGVIAAQNEVKIQTIRFHAGQEYAMCGPGYYPKAIEFFEQSKKGREAWDIYVDGTIAFLKDDGTVLTECTVKLGQIAKDDPQQQANYELLERYAEALEHDRPYSTAY